MLEAFPLCREGLFCSLFRLFRSLFERFSILGHGVGGIGERLRRPHLDLLPLCGDEHRHTEVACSHDTARVGARRRIRARRREKRQCPLEGVEARRGALGKGVPRLKHLRPQVHQLDPQICCRRSAERNDAQAEQRGARQRKGEHDGVAHANGDHELGDLALRRKNACVGDVLYVRRGRRDPIHLGRREHEGQRDQEGNRHAKRRESPIVIPEGTAPTPEPKPHQPTLQSIQRAIFPPQHQPPMSAAQAPTPRRILRSPRHR